MPDLESLLASRPILEVLDGHHDRAAFDCGEPALNIFLQRQARQNASRNLGVTRVVVPTTGDPRILGYYTLLSRSVEREELPKSNRFPSDGIGVVLLGRLAVDKTAQGQRLGTLMVAKAIDQTERAAQDIGIHALIVHALNDAAKQWYLSLNFGFEELKANALHLYLPIETIRQSGIIANEE